MNSTVLNLIIKPNFHFVNFDVSIEKVNKYLLWFDEYTDDYLLHKNQSALNVVWTHKCGLI